jgi:hypothetical protein
MSEDNEPDWLAELAKNTEALRRQLDEGGETLRRQVELLGRAAEQFIRGTRRTTPSTGPVPPFQQRVVRAADAMMRELLPPRGPVVHHVNLTTNAAAVSTVAIAGVATASASAPMPQVRVTTQAERSIGQILALVLVLIVASGLLGIQGPDRAAVDHYLTVIGVALPIAVYLWNKQNKRK